MRRLLALLLLSGLVLADSGRARAQTGFARDLAGSVFETALTILADRYIESVPFSDLSLWGLRGLTVIDPQLTPEYNNGTLRLRRGSEVVVTHRVPDNGNPVAWGTSITRITEAAWSVSPRVQQAGSGMVVQTFFDELFTHLDPYSRYVPPEQARLARSRRIGDGGIGAHLVRAPVGIVISEVIADGPAALAGLRRGDRVLSVDGRTTARQSAETVEDWISGLEDTPVVLFVRSADGRSSPRNVPLIRARVPPETVFPSQLENILVIRISGFSSSTDYRLTHVIQNALAARRPPAGVVLDLRGNRGGLLRQAVTMADLFLPRGVVARTEGRNPEANRVWRARPDDILNGLPLVVTVDGSSASAAEVLAASLADRGRAVVVGSETFGKGLVQTVSPLPDESELLVSWSRVLAPAGWPIQGLGVMPQVCTSRGGEFLALQLAALARGEALMAAELARHRAARTPLSAATIADLRTPCPSAEGHPADLSTAQFLLGNPTAYSAALLADADP